MQDIDLVSSHIFGEHGQTGSNGVRWHDNDASVLKTLDLGAAFEEWDVILTPSSAALPWPAKDVFPSLIDGRAAEPRDHAVFTGFVNASGYPAISIPCAPSPDGLPVGFQMVGRFGDEDLLIGLAAQYERAHPWAHRWPNMP